MKLSKEQVEKIRALRWRCRTDLLFLCREILGYTDVCESTHGPVIERLQQFKKPTREEFVLNDQFVNGTWKYRPIIPHQELEGKRRMLLLDPRGHFKCQTVDSKGIMREDGTYAGPTEVQVGDKILATESEYSLKKKFVKITGIEEQPPQDVYEVKTRSGKTIPVSWNHPFRLFNGFVKAQDLKKGDRIATICQSPEPIGAKYLSDSKIIGFLLGDGCMSNAAVSAKPPEMQQIIVKAAEHAGYTASIHQELTVRIQGIRSRLRELGLFETRSGNKFIPEEYFKADNNSVKELLYGLFMSDGSCTKAGISYVSKSERLIYDIQRLLYRIGIHSTIGKYKQKYKDQILEFYHLRFGGLFVKKFVDAVGWDKKFNYNLDCKKHSNINTVPKEWRSKFGKYLFERGKRPDNCFTKSLIKYDIQKHHLLNWAEALNDDDLRFLCTDEIMWDFVESVTYRGKEVTYAIETESKTICLENIITHNTSVNTIAHTIQFIINYPNIACMISVANTERAKIMLGGVLSHFTTNEAFRQLFPEHCPPASKAANFGRQDGFTTLARDFSYETRKIRNEPTVHLGTIEKAVASLHFDVIKFSDVVDEENSENREQCEKIVKAFSDKQPAVVNHRSWVYVEGTRYHNDDLYGQIMAADDANELNGNPRRYNVFMRGCFKRVNPTFDMSDLDKPFEKDKDGNLVAIFPEHMPLESLLAIKNDPVDGKSFNPQYLNDPTDPEDSALPVGKVNDKMIPFTVDPKIFHDKIRISYRDMAVDFAETTKTKSDFTAITVIGWSFANKPYVEKIEVGRWGDDEKIAILLQMYKKYKPQNVYYEDMPYTVGLFVSIQKVFQAAREYPNWIKVKRRGSKTSKEDRIGGALSSWWKTGELKFVEPSDLEKQSEGFRLLKKEARAFPKGKHDDILDCLADLMTNKTPFFDRLGPRSIEDPEVQQKGLQDWLYSEEGKKAHMDHIYGVVPEWGASKYGF